MKNRIKIIVLITMLASLVSAHYFENSAEHLSTHDEAKCTSLFHHAVGHADLPTLEVVEMIESTFVVALIEEEVKHSACFEKYPFKNKAPPKLH